MKRYSTEKKLKLIGEYLTLASNLDNHRFCFNVLECYSNKFLVVEECVRRMPRDVYAYCEDYGLVGRNPKEAIDKYVKKWKLPSFAEMEMKLIISGNDRGLA